MCVADASMLKDCLLYYKFCVQTSSHLVSLKIGKCQTRVVLSLGLTSGPYTLTV